MEEYWVEVMKIIEGAVRLDAPKVRNYSELLATKLAAAGESRVASRILKLLESSKQASIHPASSLVASRLPLDQDSRLPLADVTQPPGLDRTLVLNEHEQAELDRFLSYRRNAGRLISNGLPVPGSVLLYGPPGCGKNQVARFIAAELGLPLVTARLDSIVSSFLGNTAKNLRMVFEYGERTPCVLLLDEFDAIAKLRDDTNELGELKRVVNSLLQNIDSLSSDTIMVAATNHEQLLDSAVWRRFEFRIHIPKPDHASRVRLVSIFIKSSLWSSEDLEMAADMAENLSGADIRSICTEARRNAFLRSQTDAGIEDFTNSYFRYKMITGQGHLSSLRERATYLRVLDGRLFSYSAVARCLGTSKATVGKILREEPTHGQSSATVGHQTSSDS